MAILGVNFLVEKSLKIDSYRSENRFFGLFEYFMAFLANPEKKKFFSIFCEFFRAHIRFFGIFFGKKIAARSENRENTYLGPKKFAKNRKKNFFSRLDRNALKYLKSPKTRFFDQYESILSGFSTKKLTPQNGHFRSFLP